MAANGIFQYQQPILQNQEDVHTTVKDRRANKFETRDSLSYTPGNFDLDQQQRVKEFILQGPLLEVVGLTRETVERRLQTYLNYAMHMCKFLEFDPNNLTETQMKRIFHYYIPLTQWIIQQAQLHQKISQEACLIGVSAPQGCGKSTLVATLTDVLNKINIRTVDISIDDFYLPRAEQQKLKNKYPNNKLIEYRGNAGTHDVELGHKVLRQLKCLTIPDQSAIVPRYNKSAHNGRGDRYPMDDWQLIKGPLQVVLVEGWMLGFRAQDPLEVTKVDPQLVQVNEALKSYEAMWDRQIDSWLVIKVPDSKWVFDWRLQAEVQMRESGMASMSDREVEDFVSRFMPAYNAYLPKLYEAGPTTADQSKLIVIEVDRNRQPVDKQPQFKP